jgi:hypothetical protein
MQEGARDVRPYPTSAPNGVRATRVTTQALIATLIGLLAFAVACPAAHAESAQARMACTPSVFHLCPGAALSGNREMAKACLLRNLSRASARCQAAVRATPQQTPPDPTDPGRQGDAMRQTPASRPA